jgi:hypothetical protein
VDIDIRRREEEEARVKIKDDDYRSVSVMIKGGVRMSRGNDVASSNSNCILGRHSPGKQSLLL